ncbi:BON domain-containing protein [Campylobacter sp. 19-13652]|uniref:BON domain-containing protein n=1 Tax=Campylobacter sp. 19-13652 TaxID=2840180 RepID=UPI001C79484B|nr:BON domain-containing protein [Campylobacter sp. 19-13652]BCX78859.1 hypothetical protein LBC_03210 [Campylobacter sp. 19-13652]
MAILFSGCISVISPISNALTVYDIYSISRDKRGIITIASDKIKKLKIQSAILKSKGISNWDIDVGVFYSQVYLVGLVEDKKAYKKLLSLAKNEIKNGKIHTYIKIKQPNYNCSHAAIFSQLKADLFGASNVEGTAVRVSIVGCDVVFTGVVASKNQESSAIWFAKHIDGVDNVYSFLQVIN